MEEVESLNFHAELNIWINLFIYTEFQINKFTPKE